MHSLAFKRSPKPQIVTDTKLHNASQMTLNPFHGTGLFLCPLKTSENLWFCDVFQEVQKEIIAIKWVKDKYVSRMLIFMLVPLESMLSYSQSALVLSILSRDMNFKVF